MAFSQSGWSVAQGLQNLVPLVILGRHPSIVQRQGVWSLAMRKGRTLNVLSFRHGVTSTQVMAGLVAVVLTVVVVTAVIAVSGIRACSGTADKAIDTLAKAFKPSESRTTTINAAITSLKNENKMVVLTVTLDASVKEEIKNEWFGIPTSTRVAEVKAKDCKAQYILRMSELSSSDFTFEATRQTLVLTLPRPVVDPDFVEVQSDPKKIEVLVKSSWYNLGNWGTSKLADEARARLRRMVVETAATNANDALARDNAKRNLEEVLSTTIGASLRDGVRVEIRFH